MHRTIRHAALVAAAGTLLLGCSSGDPTIDQADLEHEVQTQLAAEVPDAPTPDIACPGDLEAEVGAEVDCELSVQGDESVYPVHVRVTSVDDDDARFDIEVADEPK
jgi:hypothetical protein